MDRLPPGRKSADSIAVLQFAGDDGRPPPPDHLRRAAKQIWRMTVACMKTGHFGPECYPLLECYCRTVVFVDQTAKALEHRGKARIEGAERKDMLRLHDMLSRSMVHLATKLRLTPRSNRPQWNYDARATVRSDVPAPWSDWGKGRNVSSS